MTFGSGHCVNTPVRVSLMTTIAVQNLKTHQIYTRPIIVDLACGAAKAPVACLARRALQHKCTLTWCTWIPPAHCHLTSPMHLHLYTPSVYKDLPQLHTLRYCWPGLWGSKARRSLSCQKGTAAQVWINTYCCNLQTGKLAKTYHHCFDCSGAEEQTEICNASSPSEAL